MFHWVELGSEYVCDEKRTALAIRHFDKILPKLVIEVYDKLLDEIVNADDEINSTIAVTALSCLSGSLCQID